MKRIGLIGGVSPASTEVYYRLINAAAKAAKGGDHSAELVIYSLDFGVILAHYEAADWPAFKAEVVRAAERLRAADCELLGICSNTTQLAADAVAEAVDLPIVRLIDTLATALKAAGRQRPLLLGTPFVMEQPFYRETLANQFAGQCLVPDEANRLEISRVIFEELVNGTVLESSRSAYLKTIAQGRAAGADSVILGCTEITLLIKQDHTDLPVFDTTALHAKAIATAALKP